MLTFRAHVLGLALAGSPCCMACHPTGAPNVPAPPVSQVVVPLQGDAEPAPAAALPARFSCAMPDGAHTTRVEFEVSSISQDGESAPLRTRAIYSVRMLPNTPDLGRAQVVLEALSASSTASPQSAWSTALDQGWITMRRAFVLVQRSRSWCFAETSCDDAEQREVAQAIGETLDLLRLPELLAKQLDGRPSDGSLSLELPEALSERFHLAGSAPGESRTAQQQGSGFPARFVTRTDAPRINARIALSRTCALESLEAELLVPASDDGGTAPTRTHRFSWRFEPAG